jgi:TetR/AcrR family transcriptional regulator, cholesterol catabolism regulator
MTVSTGSTTGASRRSELLRIAGSLFARRGFKNTTVRDIADAAGILSGSLYHHFDSKEAIVDELLSSFQNELFASYEAILAAGTDAREKIDAIVRASFEAIDQHHDEVAIFQNDAAYLQEFDRFAYLGDHNRRFRAMWIDLLDAGVRSGTLRQDLDGELVFRFIRDTVWVAVRWYRPGGTMTAQDVADQYLAILLDGIAANRDAARRAADELRTQGDS